MMALVIGTRVYTWLTLLDHLGFIRMSTWNTNLLVVKLLLFYENKDMYLVANYGTITVKKVTRSHAIT